MLRIPTYWQDIEIMMYGGPDGDDLMIPSRYEILRRVRKFKKLKEDAQQTW